MVGDGGGVGGGVEEGWDGRGGTDFEEDDVHDGHFVCAVVFKIGK